MNIGQEFTHFIVEKGCMTSIIEFINFVMKYREAPALMLKELQDKIASSPDNIKPNVATAETPPEEN